MNVEQIEKQNSLKQKILTVRRIWAVTDNANSLALRSKESLLTFYLLNVIHFYQLLVQCGDQSSMLSTKIGGQYGELSLSPSMRCQFFALTRKQVNVDAQS